MKQWISAPLAIVALACTMSSPSTTDHGTLFVGGIVAAGPQQTPQRDYAGYAGDGKIAAVGSADELRAAHPNARLVDIGGGTGLPGLIDAPPPLFGVGLAPGTGGLVGLETGRGL